MIAAPTGVAAWNINGVTLHQCCFLPVVNKSHGKACDAPLPRGPQLAALQHLWARISVLFVDFIPAFMLDRLDQHLRLARDIPHVLFGGLHVVFSGDLYQLPPPGGSFASSLRRLFEVCELEGNQRAARDPEWAALLARVRVGKWTDADLRTLSSLVIKRNSGKKPAPGAVHLHATRKAVAEDNQRYIKEHLESSAAQLHDCPAVDINVKTGAPLLPDAVWAEPENTGGLETFLQVAVGARVMLRHNIDVQDGLVNGACGTVEHVQAQDEAGEVEKIWVKFDKQAGVRWCAANENKDDRKAERKQFPLSRALQSHHHPQEPGCHVPRRCSLQHGDAGGPGLRGAEPLSNPRALHLGALQPQLPQVERQRGKGLDVGEGPTRRQIRLTALAAADEASENPTILRQAYRGARRAGVAEAKP